MKSKPFIDDMLYVVDGELLNHMLKICKRFGSMNPEYENYNPYATYDNDTCNNNVCPD